MIDQKVIWIVNQYSSTPETGLGGRHYYLAQELSKQGHKVYVIAGSYSHLLHNPKEFSESTLIESIEEDFYFVWVKLPKYSNAHSKKRIINEFDFSRKISNLNRVINDKPDVIIHSSPALISYFGAKSLAKYYKVPYVFEVRDPWPLTLTEIGGYSKNHPFVLLLQWIEDKAYKEARFVLSNFFNAVEHMQSRGMEKEKFTWIPNGVSLNEIANKKSLSNQVISSIPSNKFIVGYTGTLGEANAMSYLIDAAEIIRNHEDIHFVLIGSGKNKSQLMARTKELSLSNITFIDPIPKIQIQSVLELFDACYIGWHKNNMYRLGIAANKIPEYMYSSKPVIHSYSGAGDFIKQASAGLTVEAENPQAIADAILQLKALDNQERLDMGKRGKDFVIKNLTYESLASKLLNTLFGIKK